MSRSAAHLDAINRMVADGRLEQAPSPPCDGPGLSRRLEAAIRDAWAPWCDQEVPGTGR